MYRGISPAEIIFTPDEIDCLVAYIRTKVKSKVDDRQAQVSQQDALIGYAVELHNKIMPQPCTNIRMICTVRIWLISVKIFPESIATTVPDSRSARKCLVSTSSQRWKLLLLG
jgi:hypothetical protein